MDYIFVEWSFLLKMQECFAKNSSDSTPCCEYNGLDITLHFAQTVQTCHCQVWALQCFHFEIYLLQSSTMFTSSLPPILEHSSHIYLRIGLFMFSIWSMLRLSWWIWHIFQYLIKRFGFSRKIHNKLSVIVQTPRRIQLYVLTLWTEEKSCCAETALN